MLNNQSNQPYFVVKYLFDKNLVSKEQVMSLFTYGLNQIEHQQNKLKDKKELSDVDFYYLESLQESKNQTLDFKNNSSIQETETGWLLSLPINWTTQKFNDINTNGIRPWLRNYLEDFFIKHIILGMSMANIKMAKKSFESNQDFQKEKENLDKINEAFEKSIQNAYLKKSEGFWIDNE